MINAEGKKISLSSYKGKIVFVDFWATWCKGCIVAMPQSYELMEKFKNRNDMVFLYINISDDIERWKKFLAKENMEGVSLYANKEQTENLYKTYSFNGIPHYVLIDKQGKLINANLAGLKDAEKIISGIK